MNKIAATQKLAELATERLGLLERIEVVDLQMRSEMKNLGIDVPEGNTATPKRKPTSTQAPAASTGEKKKRGRPAGSKNKTDKTENDGESEGRLTLPAVLIKISEEENKPLKIADFVMKAREAGYTTKSTDFTNMVYQCLCKLVTAEKFVRDTDTMEFRKAA